MGLGWAVLGVSGVWPMGWAGLGELVGLAGCGLLRKSMNVAKVITQGFVQVMVLPV